VAAGGELEEIADPITIGVITGITAGAAFRERECHPSGEGWRGGGCQGARGGSRGSPADRGMAGGCGDESVEREAIGGVRPGRAALEVGFVLESEGKVPRFERRRGAGAIEHAFPRQAEGVERPPWTRQWNVGGQSIGGVERGDVRGIGG